MSTDTKMIPITDELVARIEAAVVFDPADAAMYRGRHRTTQHLQTHVIRPEAIAAAVRPNAFVSEPVSVEPVRQRRSKLAFLAHNIAGRFRP